jgi:hypothetical protein
MNEQLGIELAGKLKILKVAFCLLGGLLLVFAVATFFSLSGMHEGHISANVPDRAQFSAILTRDLNSYFSEKLARQVDVKFELLRDKPTQSGVAFPKFYAWVTVSSLQSGQKIEEGAVRLSAENKASFAVTEFISTDHIQKHPDDLKRLFPSDVIAKISNHL